MQEWQLKSELEALGTSFTQYEAQITQQILSRL